MTTPDLDTILESFKNRPDNYIILEGDAAHRKRIHTFAETQGYLSRSEYKPDGDLKKVRCDDIFCRKWMHTAKTKVKHYTCCDGGCSGCFSYMRCECGNQSYLEDCDKRWYYVPTGRIIIMKTVEPNYKKLGNWKKRK